MNTDASNPKCPDFSSHHENVADRIAPGWRSEQLGWDVKGAILEEAQAEYLACDGHY